MNYSQLLFDISKNHKLNEKCSFSNANKRIVGYISWDNEFSDKLLINNEKDAEPITFMLQSAIPSSKIEEFYIDTYNQDNKHPELEKLIEKCRIGEFDLIVCSTIYEMGQEYDDIFYRIRILRSFNKPVYVYFIAENIYTGDSASDERLEMHALVEGYFTKIKDRKSKMRENVCLAKKYCERVSEI